MWKKIGVTIIGLLCTMTVVFAMHQELNAISADNPYYAPGDTFKKTSKSTFLMGGYEWSIAHTENGRSLIYTNVDTSNNVFYHEVDTKLQKFQNEYASHSADSYFDVYGKQVKAKNDVSQLSYISLSQYLTITKNETDSSILGNHYTWLSDVYDGYHMLVRAMKPCADVQMSKLPQANFVCTITENDKTAREGAVVVFEIDAIADTTIEAKALNPSGYEAKKATSGMTVATVEAYSMLELPLFLSTSAGGTQNDANSNFELVDAIGDLATSNIDEKKYSIKIKDTGPNIKNGVLLPGTYPVCANIKETAVPYSSCVEIKVNRLDTTVSYTNKEITKIKIGDSPIEETITTTNDEITTQGGKYPPVYELSGGSSVLTIQNDVSNPNGFTISPASSSDETFPATYDLTVTLPETDSYKSATAKKQIYVFKGLDKLVWTPTKTDLYTTDDVTANSKVGSLLAKDGDPSYTYALTTPEDSEHYSTDNRKYDISNPVLEKDVPADVITTSDLTEGTYTISFKVTDQNNDTVYETATIQVGKKKQKALEFKEGSQTATSKTIYFDDKDKYVLATGGEPTIVGNPTYALSNPADSTYLKVTADGTLHPQAITGDGKTVKVKATKKGNDSFADVSAEIEITILPAKQTISFTDATDPKKIKLKTEGVVQDAKGILTSNGKLDSGVGGITYTSSDPSVFTVGDDGKITTVGVGSAKLVATLNASGKAGYNKNYETATKEKTITIYDDMKFTWEPTASTANKIEVTDMAGTIMVEGNTGKVTFTIKEGEENFKFLNPEVNPATLQWNKAITADDIKTSNNFKITIIATDDNGSQEYEVSITVGLAENDFYYVDPSDGKTKITALSETYQKGKTVQLSTYTSNGGTVSYKLKNDGDATILTVSKTGKVTILKTGGPVIVEATVPAKDGYATKTIELPITITKSEYDAIAFSDPETTYVAYSKSVTSNQPATLTPEGEIQYRVETSSEDVCTIDESGTVTALKAGTCKIKATSTDENYEVKSTTKDVIFYEGAVASFTQAATPQAVNPDKTGDTGNAKEEAVFGPVSVTGGLEKPYNIQIKSGDYAFQYFELTTINGNQRARNLKLKSGVSITADILKEGITKGVIEQDTTNKDQYNWKIKVLPDTNSDPQEIIVHIIGADPILTFEKEVERKLTTTYEKDGSIDLSVKRGDSVMDTGISVEGTVGYATYIESLAGFTTDAQLNGTGIVKSNCDDDDQVLTGKDFKLTPKAEASDGYKSGKGTPTPVIIKKADHPDVDFADPDTILSSYMQSVDKGFTGILPDDKHLEITPQGESTWSGTEFIKYNNGDTNVPSVTITPNGFEGTITYIVNGGGTANYKPIENKEIHLAFAAEGGISYKPIKITYGDDTKKVIDYISDADMAKNTYTYAPVEGNTYVNEEGEELFTLDGSTSTITTIQVGKTKVNVTRTDEKGNVITQAIPVEIVKKEITLTYESNTIYTGEALPTPAFKEPDAGVLVGSDTIADFPIPEEAVHYDGTEVLIDSETTGTYDTKGNWTNDELTTVVNPNYEVTIKAGKLTIKKDTVKDNWYHLEAPDGKTVSKTAWHNYLVDVVLDTAIGTAGTYDQISNTKTFTDTDKTRFTVTKEDENKEDVYFRIAPDNEVEHKGAITSTQTTVKIDMTKPNVTKVTGYPVNTDGLSELIHNLTFGMFFKPGVDVTIETEDPQPAGETGITVSGVNTVSYKVYKLGEKGEFDPTQTPKIDEGKVDANGKISFKINNVGNYRICAIAKDNATNPSNESCSDVNVKKVNVDIDGDGTNDFVDSDANGCPDLNIILGNDSKGNPVKLNVAEKDKKHPYMNIDSDGDGKADLNIDTDHDNKPDLNLVILKDSDWKPTICVVESKLKDYTEPVEYCTGTKVKAQINVDTDGDGVPNINIDTDGDFVADYNIDTDSDGKPDLNIGKKHTTWIPDQDYNRNDFFYDSIGYHKPLINIDTNGDGKPDINIDFDGDGSADINIDTNGDNIPDINIDGDGDGKPDYNLDTNEDGNPTKNVIILDEWKVDINGNYKDKEFGTMRIEGKTEISDSGIVMEKSDGQFLPNTAIKVQDISSQFDEQVRNEIDKMAGDQEIKKVYDVDYLEGNGSKQPDGIVIVKIPADPDIRHPKILVEKEDGSFEEVSVTEKDGYYVFETNYIGKVSVLGDVETGQEPNPQPDLKPAPDAGNNEHPSTSVKGTYTTQGSSSLGMGGAITGDSINPTLYVFSILTSIGILCFLLVVKKRKKI